MSSRIEQRLPPPITSVERPGEGTRRKSDERPRSKPSKPNSTKKKREGPKKSPSDDSNRDDDAPEHEIDVRVGGRSVQNETRGFQNEPERTEWVAGTTA